MKKSVEILGLPIISITEGRELGISKSLLIDAKNGMVAALTIEDDDWYRGVKLIPYESIIAIGQDAITITHSENILNLEEAGDYERLLVENIRVIGTKAITKTGRIQGRVTEVFIGMDGRIEQCEITTPSGSVANVTAEQISIFGKQVTVVDIEDEKKNLTDTPAFEPAFVAFSEEPTQETWTPSVESSDETVDTSIVESTEALEEVMTPEPDVEIPTEPTETVETPAVDVPPVEEETPAVVAETVDDEEQKLTSMNQQAEDLKAALQKARSSKKSDDAEPQLSQKRQVEKAVDERRRRVLLGKHATKTITAESGTVVVEAGGEVTEEVLQRARLSNKFIELSMNVQ